MFRCQLCNDVSFPGVPIHRVVLERQVVEHKARPHAHPTRSGTWRDDPGGRGTQIVREAVACGLCAAKQTAKERTAVVNSDGVLATSLGALLSPELAKLLDTRTT